MFGFHSRELTDEEKTQAIQTLRERLSDDSQPVEEQLRQGGEAGLQGLDEHTLRRWLAAESFDIDKAEKRLRAHAIWRKAEFPEGRVLEVEIADELATKKVYLQGLDKLGRRIIYLKVNRHSRSLRDLKQSMRLLCYSLDIAIKQADAEKNPGGAITGIFDLRGLTMDSIDSSALRGVFDMLQAHYPERLGTLWMFESPGIFWALWKAVSPFIDSHTKKKVIFVSGTSAAKEMEAEIDPQIMPKECGGEAELVAIQDWADSSPAAVHKSAAANGAGESSENGAIMGP